MSMAEEDNPVADAEDSHGEDVEDSQDEDHGAVGVEDSHGVEGVEDSQDEDHGAVGVEDAEDSQDVEVSHGAGDVEGAEDSPPGDTAADLHSESPVASETKSAAGRAKVAALVVGTVLAGAAVVVGAVWAITAIAGDDDRGYDAGVPYYAPLYDEGHERWYDERQKGYHEGYDEGQKGYHEGYDERQEGYHEGYDEGYRGESVAPDRSRRDQPGRERRADRDQRWRFDRDRGERFGRDSGKRTDRDKGDHRDGDRRESSAGSEPSKPADEECSTIHRFGSGENAVTILACRSPGAGWPEFEPGEGGHFRFRKLPRDAFPLFGMGGEQWPFPGRQRPFGPGPMPRYRDGGPLADGWPFTDGRPREGELPFGLEEFFGGERFGEDGLPFGLEEFFGGERFGEDGLPFEIEEFLEGRLDRGDRGFRFRGDGAGDGICFLPGEEQEECIADLDRLSDEERAQLEQMLEMLENFGLSGFLGALPGFLEGLESGFAETPTGPAGATGA